MSTIKKTIKFDNDADSLKLDPFQVFFEANDSVEKLFVAIHDNSAETSESEDGTVSIKSLKKFALQVNQSKIISAPISADQIVTQRITRLSKQRVAIYQFFINYSEFISGENVVELYEITSDSTATTKEKRKLIGKVLFFLKEENTNTNVTLQRPGIEPTPDQIFWDYISNHALYFQEYEKFIDTILCGPDNKISRKTKFFDNSTDASDLSAKIRSPFIKSEEYNLIKFATDFYMLAKFGLDPAQISSYIKNGRLPYYDIIVDKIKDDVNFNLLISDEDSVDCANRENERILNPIMIELIWNYWMEQGMLVQTMNFISP